MAHENGAALFFVHTHEIHLGENKYFTADIFRFGCVNSCSAFRSIV
jgi:hypothetical protein